MKTLSKFAHLGGATLALAACGGSDDASTEATPESVEVDANAALEAVVDEPVVDEGALGPPIDPSETAPDLQSTEEAAEAAAGVADEFEAALDDLDALDGLDAVEAAETAVEAVEPPLD